MIKLVIWIQELKVYIITNIFIPILHNFFLCFVIDFGHKW